MGSLKNITIMKKTYKNPTLTVVKIQAARILAGSLELQNKDAKSVMARGARFSDDDWEEE